MTMFEEMKKALEVLLKRTEEMLNIDADKELAVIQAREALDQFKLGHEVVATSERLISWRPGEIGTVVKVSVDECMGIEFPDRTVYFTANTCDWKKSFRRTK